MLPNLVNFIGFWAMDATKPYEFVGFGAMDIDLRSKTLPGAPGGSILGPRTKDLASGGPRNLISRDTLPSKRGNLICGTPLYKGPSAWRDFRALGRGTLRG